MNRFRERQSFLIYIFIASIFLLGFFLRAQETISGNYLFLLDQGRDMMDVKGIVFDHHLTLIGPYTSLGGVFQGPLYYYLLAIPTALFDGNPWGNMLLMLLLSMSVLFAVFYFMNKYFGLVAALITTILFAVSPEAIAAATYFWNPHPMWLILVVYIFALYNAVKNRRLGILLLWPLVAISFHFQTALGFFLLLATTIYILIFQRHLLFRKLFWFSFFLSLIFFLPQVLFDMRHDFLMTKSILKIFKGSGGGLFVGGENHGYFSLLGGHIAALRINFNSSFIQENPFESFSLAMALLGIFSYIYSWKIKKSFLKNEQLMIHVLIGIILIIFCLVLLYPFPIRAWFLTGFESFYLILIGLLLSKLYPTLLGKGVLLVFLIIILVDSGLRIDTLYFHPPNDGGVAKIKGKSLAIEYIYKDAKDKKFGLLVFNPPVVTYAYDYLIWWRAHKTHGYIPHKNKKGLVYLLIEPDYGKPWSYNGWLETVIKTGTVIDTVTLPSGLIVQKRMF